jgi:HK97 family phage portal protein
MSAVLATRRGNFEMRGANPYSEWGMSAPPPPGGASNNVGGLHVTTESATQVAAVYACCSIIGDSVASLPLRALDKPAWVNTAEELELPPLLIKPYEAISRIDWMVCFIWALALRGNFFGQIIERDKLGYPLQIMPVNPDVVQPQKTGRGDIEWRFAGKLVPTEDVFHVRYQAMPGMLFGLNPVKVLAHTFGIARVQDVHTETIYRNGADPRGVIEAKNKLTPDGAKKLIASWKSLHQGPNLGSLPAVLDEEAKFNPITISPSDLELLQSRKWSAEEISGMVFRVPAHKLNLTERQTSYGRGIEQQERSYVSDTLAGYLCRGELALTECLPDGQFANFDLRHRIRGDSVQRAQVGSLMMFCGAWCADDVRATFDMPPLPKGAGKETYVPINTEMYKMALEALKELQNSEKEAGQEPIQIPPVSGKANGKGNPKNVPAPA